VARLCAQRCVRAGLRPVPRVSPARTQLRAFMKGDPRDLLGEFRGLAPHRRLIQRLILLDIATHIDSPIWRPRGA
jgi:hypothetical protein